MRSADYFGYTWRNLTRAQLRVLLTVAAVVIGATLVVVMTSVGGGIQRNVLESIRAAGGLNEIIVSGSGGGVGGFAPPRPAGGLNAGTVAQIESIPGVVAVLPELVLFGGAELTYDDLTAQPLLAAAPPERLAAYGFSPAQGGVAPSPGEVVLGARVAERFFDANRQRVAPPDLFGQAVHLVARRPGGPAAPPGGPSGAPGGLPGLPGLPGLAPAQPRFDRELQVVGVLQGTDTQDDFTAWVHPDDLLAALQFLAGRRYDPATEGYSAARVKAASTEQVRSVQQAITALDLQATSPLSVLDQVNQFLLVLQLLLGTIGLVALIVSGLGVANTMLMATFERTREIGILKALGATEGQIARLFLLEASFIGVLGAAAGLLLGWLATQVINLVVLQLLAAQTATTLEAPRTLLYTPTWVVPAVVVCAWFIAVAAGLYPALRAARLNIGRALRAD